MTTTINPPTTEAAEPVIEAERFILGTALAEIDHTLGADDLIPTQFYLPRHGAIWRAIQDARAAGDPTDPVAVGERLRAAGDLQRAGGMHYLTECTSAAMGPGTVAHHAGIIREASTRRRRAEHLARLSQLAGNDEQWQRHAPELLGDLTAAAGATVATKGFARTIMRRSQLRNLPPVEPLIDGVISLRSTVMLVGSTGAGKTFLTVAWACAIGTGTPWLGRPVHRARVLYTVGEGANGLDDRVTAWEEAWGVKVSDDDVIFSIRPASLVEMDTWIEMRAEATEQGCRVVVLDTFSSLAPDADETKDAAKILRRMADLAAAIDGTVILVHHPGWGDVTRARGGSQLEANADEVLILHGTNTDPMIALERKKVKEGVAGEKVWLRRKAAHGSVIIEGVAHQERAEAVASTAEQVARSVFDVPFTRTQLRNALVERLSVSESTAYEYISKLSRDKRIRLVSGKGRSALYEVVGAP